MKDTQIYRWVKTKERLPQIIETKQIVYRDAHGNIGVFIAHPNRKLESFEHSFYEWLEEITLPNKRETPESILALHFGSDLYKIMDAGYGKHIIAAMEEYASQFSTSVPVSEEEKNELRKEGWVAREDYNNGVLRDEFGNLMDRQTYLSSFLPKKP